jgi:hypothetical protein
MDHDTNHLLLYCSASHQVLVFDRDGNYIRSHQVDLAANHFSYISNGYAAFFGNFTSNTKYEKEQMTPNLLITRPDDYNVQYTDLFFPTEINCSALTMPASCFSSYQSGTVSLLEAYNDTIYHLSHNSIDRAFYIDFGSMKKDKSFYSLLGNHTTSLEQMVQYGATHDVCNTIAMTETSTCLFFAYNHKTTYHFVFYDKQNQQVVDVCRKYTQADSDPVFPIKNDINGGPFAIPYYTDGDAFYGTVESYELQNFKESVPDKLVQQFNNVSEENNPIIAVMILKNQKP